MNRLRARRCQLLLIGWQDRGFRQLPEPSRKRALDHALTLRQVAGRLEIPILCTELDPRSQGRTMPIFGGLHTLEHHAMSAAEDTALLSILNPPHPSGPADVSDPATRTQIVLAGLETHLSVQQTALDLQEAGLDVLLAVDACTSARPEQHELALRRLSTAGVHADGTEAIVFQWVPDNRDPLHNELWRMIR